MQMTLMTTGLYNEPAGAYLPSILYERDGRVAARLGGLQILARSRDETATAGQGLSARSRRRRTPTLVLGSREPAMPTERSLPRPRLRGEGRGEGRAFSSRRGT